MYIGHMDYDGDDIIQSEEIDRFLKMFNNGRGFDTNLNDGQKAKPPETQSKDGSGNGGEKKESAD